MLESAAIICMLTYPRIEETCYIIAPIQEGRMSNNAASIVAFIAAVLGILFLVSQESLFSENVISISVQVLSFGLMLWARRTFGLRSFHAAAAPTKGGLVTTGPYRYWRHPIYAAITYFVWAGAIPHKTLLSLLGVLVVTVALYTRIRIEERMLQQSYPEYEQYMKQTKRLIPFVI
jgi:protein-S-isoprenylcysteine O-methyltransferase Ste14